MRVGWIVVKTVVWTDGEMTVNWFLAERMVVPFIASMTATDLMAVGWVEWMAV